MTLFPVKLIPVLFPAVILVAIPTGAGGTTHGARWQPCALRELPRTVLADALGRPLYVEPVATSLSQNSLLLAGTPNYLYNVTASGDMVGVARDSIFGVVVDQLLRSSIVPNPVAGVAMSMRADARGSGGWDIVFAELPRTYQFPDPETGLKLWHGTFDGVRWGPLTPIPIPPAIQLNSFSSSRLVSSGDTLVWAMKYGKDTTNSVVVFERAGGNWSHKLLPVHSAAGVTLVKSQDDGIVLLPVSLNEVADRYNAVPLLSQRTAWQRQRFLMEGGNQGVLTLQYTHLQSGMLLSWLEQVGDQFPPITDAYALLPASPGVPARQLFLADTATQLIALETASRRPLWVLDNHNPVTGASELRFLTERNNTVAEIGKIDNPFTGRYAAMERSRDTVIVAGPLLTTTAGKPPLTTLLVRVVTSCPRAGPSPAVTPRGHRKQVSPSKHPPQPQ